MADPATTGSIMWGVDWVSEKRGMGKKKGEKDRDKSYQKLLSQVFIVKVPNSGL